MDSGDHRGGRSSGTDVDFRLGLDFHAQEAPRYAGPTDKGFLLPNGWTLKPAGQHVPLADLPLNIVPLADNRHVLVATSGYNAHELSLIDLEQKKVIDRQAVRQSWFGLAVSPEADTIWWSGGGGNTVHAFRLADRHLTVDQRTRARSQGQARHDQGDRRTFGGGLALDSDRKVLYSLDVDRGTISALDLTSRKELKSATAGTRPYDVALVAQRRTTIRLRLGRPRGARPRPGRPSHRRQDRRRRASQPDRRSSQGRSDLRRVRLEQLRLGDRHPAGDRHRNDPNGPLSEGPRGKHAGRAGGRA